MDKNTLLTGELRLELAQAPEVLDLYHWFADGHQIASWGGPGFYYPMSSEAFLQTLNVNDLCSFWLMDKRGEKLGFGQCYLRLERYHLGRLVISPQHRRKGLGQVLVTLLLEQAPRHLSVEGADPQASLFVMRDNPAAIGCYQALGFVETQYPQEIPGGLDNCAYMIKSLTTSPAT